MNIHSTVDLSENRSTSINMDAETFRTIGHQLINDVANFLSAIEDRPITNSPLPHELQAKLPSSFPINGMDPSQLIKETWELMVKNSLFNGHPRFWGYITSSPAPIGMLGDLLASAINSNCGAFVLSPMATEIEKQTIQWLGQLIGYPAKSGIMVSGGNMANFVGFLAARKAMAGWKIRELGLQPSNGKWRIYTSAETHTWVNKAADLFGLGLESINWIPVDNDQRMDIEKLKQALADDKSSGWIPLMIIGTAGSVGTGTVDPLDEIAALCKQYSCWFHIDGAYGGFAAALPELAETFKGLDQADSIAIDPHKWLYSPIEAGCTLVKNADALTEAFSFHPVYYNFDGEQEPQTNFYERGFQNSRGFRALKVWLGMRQIGAVGHINLIREDIKLAKILYDTLKDYNELEVFTHHLSITTFRYKPAGMDPLAEQDFLNKLNTALLNKLQQGGEVFPSNAVINGNFVLRVCIVNFRTRLSDINSLPAIVVREGKRVEEEMRLEKQNAG
jgi:glutamate/tyrosine decarboxylase-like PLP-dependent enzyme